MVLIDKFKNESYGYKCERDQLKVQIQDLKIFKEKCIKEMEKIQDKYNKAKERIALLEKSLVKMESEKREVETKYITMYNDLLFKHESLTNEYDILKSANFELNTLNIDLSSQMEEYKERLEDSLNDYRELKTKYSKLEAYKNNVKEDKSE
jgi:predicted nuclease with TOPRIM domain